MLKEKLYLIRNKFYFHRKERDLLFVIILLILGAAGIGLYYINFKHNLNKTFMCLIIYLFSFIYYKWKLNDVMRYMSKGVIEQNAHSLKCFKMFGTLMKAHFIFVMLQIPFVFIDSKGDFINVWLLCYIFLIGYAIMNYQCIIFFCKEGYFTGSYFIPYSDISEITCIREQVTQDGILYTCKLEKNGEVIGYERLIFDDYYALKKYVNAAGGLI